MRKTSLVLLSIFAVVSTASGPSFSRQAVPKVFTGGTGATTKAVNIFHPTQNRPPADRAEDSQTIVVNKTINIYSIQHSGHETRAQRYHRVFGHRYLGFIKQYSGNKYPF